MYRQIKAGIADDAVSTVIPDAVIYMPFAELVDVEKEIARLEKEAKRLEGEIKRAKGMLSNEKFISKAPSSKGRGRKRKIREIHFYGSTGCRASFSA